MKLSKLTKIILLASIVALVVALLFPMVTRMSGVYTDDSGFDGGYDSGGWDSGSDWDSGSSWDSDSGGGGSSSGSPIEFFVFIYVFTLFISLSVQFNALKYSHGNLSVGEHILIGFCLLLSFVPLLNIIAIIVGGKLGDKKQDKYVASSNSKNVSASYVPIPNKNCDELLAKYGFNSNAVVQEAFASYKRIQVAWMNGDVEPVRDILSDEIYNMYKTQLITLAVKKQKNMMEDITFVSGTVVNVIEQEDDVAIVINMKVTCRDYIINATNNQVVRGNKNHKCNYNYSLTFTFNKNSAKVITHCPGCNTELPLEGKSIKCEYCGTTINRESTNLVMTKKTMISQS